jgi:hypothetical protein
MCRLEREHRVGRCVARLSQHDYPAADTDGRCVRER